MQVVQLTQTVAGAGGGDQFALGRLRAKAVAGDGDPVAQRDAVLILK